MVQGLLGLAIGHRKRNVNTAIGVSVFWRKHSDWRNGVSAYLRLRTPLPNTLVFAHVVTWFLQALLWLRDEAPDKETPAVLHYDSELLGCKPWYLCRKCAGHLTHTLCNSQTLQKSRLHVSSHPDYLHACIPTYMQI